MAHCYKKLLAEDAAFGNEWRERTLLLDAQVTKKKKKKKKKKKTGSMDGFLSTLLSIAHFCSCVVF